MFNAKVPVPVFGGTAGSSGPHCLRSHDALTVISMGRWERFFLIGSLSVLIELSGNRQERRGTIEELGEADDQVSWHGCCHSSVKLKHRRAAPTAPIHPWRWPFHIMSLRLPRFVPSPDPCGGINSVVFGMGFGTHLFSGQRKLSPF